MKGVAEKLVTPARVLVIGLACLVSGGVLMARAATAYDGNVESAFWTAQVRDAWLMPPECAEVSP